MTVNIYFTISLPNINHTGVSVILYYYNLRGDGHLSLFDINYQSKLDVEYKILR